MFGRNAVRELEARPANEGLSYFGVAEVLESDASHAAVRLSDLREVWVRLALPLPYEPVPGDQLLVIAHRDEHYAIGVLEGRGRTSLAIQGDVELRAIGGALRLEGETGLEIRSPEVQVEASKLTTIASSVTEKFDRLYQRVRGLRTRHSGETHEIVDGTAFQKSRRSTLLADETITVNGKQIKLG
jgi:hypothetical protein